MDTVLSADRATSPNVEMPSLILKLQVGIVNTPILLIDYDNRIVPGTTVDEKWRCVACQGVRAITGATSRTHNLMPALRVGGPASPRPPIKASLFNLVRYSGVGTLHNADQGSEKKD